MDITTQAVTETAAIHLKGLDGELLYSNGDKAKPVQIVIYGPGSRQYADVESRATNRTVKRMQDNDGKLPARSADDRREETAEDMAAITVRFENFGYPPAGDKDGVELFRAFYADPTLGHMTEQVLKAMRDWGKFKPGSTGI